MFNKKKKRIFLDYASSTPVEPEVFNAMKPWLSHDSEVGNFANPSALYKEALIAKDALSEARKKIADILSAQEKEIIFTSGGTESNNLALLGIFEKARYMTKNNTQSKDFVPHVITTVIEHPSILETCKEIERRGGEVTYIPVSSEGLVSPQDIGRSLKENTVLVSVMYANNEIGTIQPIKEIGKVIREWKYAHTKISNERVGPYFHTDACQAALYLELNVLRLGVDAMTLDGIKIHGPRGAGVLYIRNIVQISSSVFGGGQERGVRSGTENVAGAVGMTQALQIAEGFKLDGERNEMTRLSKLRDKTIKKILALFPTATLNGSATMRLPNNINICFPCLDAEFAVISLDIEGIAASYSSSCLTLKEDSSSYVIKALGKPECANSSLRFTLGRETTKEDLDRLVEVLKKIVK